MDNDTTCCDWLDMDTTDDGDVIYPTICDCICHSEDEDAGFEW